WMEFVDRMAHQPVLALPARVQHAQDAEQRGLASAGRAHDGEELAFTDVQVDLPQDVRASRLRLVVPLDAAQPDHRDSARGVSLEVFRATARGADDAGPAPRAWVHPGGGKQRARMCG